MGCERYGVQFPAPRPKFGARGVNPASCVITPVSAGDMPIPAAPTRIEIWHAQQNKHLKAGPTSTAGTISTIGTENTTSTSRSGNTLILRNPVWQDILFTTS